MQSYDPNNIFAKILRGEMPATKVYEDEVALAFMDIMPRGDGHVLVIPKVPARGILDMPPEALGPYMQRVQTVAAAAKKRPRAVRWSSTSISTYCPAGTAWR